MCGGGGGGGGGGPPPAPKPPPGPQVVYTTENVRIMQAGGWPNPQVIPEAAKPKHGRSLLEN